MPPRGLFLFTAASIPWKASKGLTHLEFFSCSLPGSIAQWQFVRLTMLLLQFAFVDPRRLLLHQDFVVMLLLRSVAVFGQSIVPFVALHFGTMLVARHLAQTFRLVALHGSATEGPQQSMRNHSQKFLTRRCSNPWIRYLKGLGLRNVLWNHFL